MKTIIAGSRGITSYPPVACAIKASGFTITEVVSGGARGVDILGEVWAQNAGIPAKRFVPDWNGLGRKAGIVRNHAMGDYAEALIAVWDGESHGTLDMIQYATARGLRVFVLNLKEHSPCYSPSSKPQPKPKPQLRLFDALSRRAGL